MNYNKNHLTTEPKRAKSAVNSNTYYYIIESVNTNVLLLSLLLLLLLLRMQPKRGEDVDKMNREKKRKKHSKNDESKYIYFIGGCCGGEYRTPNTKQLKHLPNVRIPVVKCYKYVIHTRSQPRNPKRVVPPTDAINIIWTGIIYRTKVCITRPYQKRRKIHSEK